MTALVVVIGVLAVLVFLGLCHPHWFLTIRPHQELLGYFYGGEFVRKQDVWRVINGVKPWIDVYSDDRMPPDTFILGSLEHASRYIHMIPEGMEVTLLPMDESRVIRFIAEERVKLRLTRPPDASTRVVQV